MVGPKLNFLIALLFIITSQLTKGENSTRNAFKHQIRIIGGEEAKRNEFPWRCHIEGVGRFCGCSLISSRWVLTAAHCTHGISARNLRVVFGVHNRSMKEDGVQRIPTYYFVNHERYNHYQLAPPYDVALIRLQYPVNITKTVSPISLPWNYSAENFVGSRAVTSGWGTTVGQGRTVKVLRKTFLQIISNRDCAKYWGKYITETMICGMENLKTTRAGDSGGSMDLKRNGHYYLLGITGWGDRQCSGYVPSVYTRITSYLSWIKSKTGNTFYKYGNN